MAVKKKAQVNRRKIGELIDQMQDLDDRMGVLQNKTKKIHRSYMRLEADLIDEMGKAALNKAGGSKASATLKMAAHPNIANPKQFFKYVHQHRAYELFQRRVNAKAYFERLENGDPVPGIKVFEHMRCKITKKRN